MKDQKYLEIWESICEKIRSYEEVDNSQFTAFFQRLHLQVIAGNYMMVTADTPFIKSYTEKHLLHYMHRALQDLYGCEFTIDMEIDPTEPAPLSPIGNSAGTVPQTPAQQYTGNPIPPQDQSQRGYNPYDQGGYQGNPTYYPNQGNPIYQSAQQGQYGQGQQGQQPPMQPGQFGQAQPGQFNQVQQGQFSQTDATQFSQTDATQFGQPDASQFGQPDPNGINQMQQGQGAQGQAVPQAFPGQGTEPGSPLVTPSTQDGDSGSVSSSNGITSDLTFENYVIGESNRMAYSMALAVAENPGKPQLNPLFIYGRSGLGKTHLMRAIQNYVETTYVSNGQPMLKAVYVDSSQFLNEYTDATIEHSREKNSFKRFKEKYESADILLIDDVQALRDKPQTLDIVFQIFNSFIDRGKQVVLSADIAPKNIDIDERYQSRFNSGATFDIQPPEMETKLGIIKHCIETYKRTENKPNLSVPQDVQEYIAENSSSNIRELKSALYRVIFEMTLNDRTIDVNTVSALLENHFTGGATKRLTIADIQKQVEAYYKVSHSEIVGKKRTKNIAHARQVAMYLCREMLDTSYSAIGKEFGGKDHTTVLYSVDNVKEKTRSSKEVQEEIDFIKKMIKEA